MKDLVLVGGGHAHVAVLKSFGMKPVPGVALTLVARDVDTPYSGMLPGLVAGHYAHDDAHIDLGPLARFADARLIHDEAVGLDLDRGFVLCSDRPPVAYDLLSINIGSAPGAGMAEGARDHAIPVKPIDRFIPRWERLVEEVLRAEGPVRIGTVGAGAGGVELTLAAQYRLARLLEAEGRPSDQVTFHLITDTPTILPTHNARVRAKFDRVLAHRGVEVLTDCRVTRVTSDAVHCAGGTVVPLDHVFWVTAAAAAPWPGSTGLDVGEKGFIRVDETLRSVSHDTVFAVGDIAEMVRHPREKAGVFAVRQGRALADNLRRALLGAPLKPYRPQKEFLSLISTGDRNAVAARSVWAFEGRWVWRWKDRIDRRFMDKYNHLPEMDVAEGPDGVDADDRMRCGGCGAKVAGPALSRALARLDGRKPDDVLLGLEAGEDAAVLAVPEGRQLVQSVDYFRAFVSDPFLFGQVTANHALGDLYAMGAEPRAALAIATVPFGPEAKVEETLYQLLAGAVRVLDANDTVLVGGHSSEGAELGLGFSVTGFAEPGALLMKGGMRPGDRLILTKPLGTGTLFAADMRARAKGRWIDGALASMLLSSRDAASTFAKYGATACTDVTGFGLVGHLLEMVRASHVTVELDLEALPVLEGVEATLGEGIVSSLHEANASTRTAIAGLDAIETHPLFPLLFDPQTAGGLLASVPGDAAEPCLAELQARGLTGVALIGRVGEAGDSPVPVAITR